MAIAGLWTTPTSLSGSPAAHGTAPSPSALLEAARAAAAAGHGPWGPVASPPSTLHPSAGPNLTFGVIMTYDEFDGYVLAVSLNASAGPYNNTYGPNDLTWKFAGGNWSLIATSGQVPSTLSPGLVYDGADQYVLLYGGRLMGTGAPAAPVTNQTWSYRAGTWTNLSGNLTTPAPYAIDFPNPVYDAADEYVLLYNEIGITPTNPNGYLNTTWTYVGGTWMNITGTAGTPPQMFGGMAYDAADRYVVYFGGYTWWNQLTNASWTFRGGVWSNVTFSVTGAPSPRMNFGITYDTTHGNVLLYGGFIQLGGFNASAFSYQTWAYGSGAWTLLSSNGSVWSIQTMAYDSADGEAVLLGSNSSMAVSPNVVTWTYSGGTWTAAAPGFSRTLWATDVGRALTLTVSQSPNAGGVVYQYSGLPPGCTSANTPSLICTPTSPGTYHLSVVVTGAAGFLATAGATIQVSPAPTVVRFSLGGPVGEVGISLDLNVTATPGTGGLSYAYVGLPPGCVSTSAPTLTCVPTAAGTFVVMAEVTDGIGVTVASNASVVVEPPLAIGSITADRTVLDVGQAIAVTSGVQGGVGPFVYGYAGLPAGCGTLDLPVLSCRPSSVGAFSIGVSATDALGAIAQGATAITVNPLPSIVSVALSNATVGAGGSLDLVTTVSGGTAPFQYLYDGLPTTCQSPTPGTLSCSALPSGNYAVGITVIDATGASVNSSAAFVVLPAPAKLQPGPMGGEPAPPWFWFGFAVATLGIAAAAGLGGYRLRLARQGREIVRGLRAEGGAASEAPPAVSGEAEAESHPPG